MKTLFLLAFAALSCGLYAQNVDVIEKKYTGWNSNNLTFNKQALITGPKNTYGINFLLQKPNQNGETSFYMVLTEPRINGGFGQHQCQYLQLEVNKIPARKIMPGEDAFRTWKNEKSAGADMTFNFNGTKIIMSSYVTKDSPLLWLTFRPVEQQLEPLKSFQIKLAAQVSGINGYKTLKAENTVAKTAAREIVGQEWKKAKNTLSAEDKWLILYDKVLDGSGKEKGYGPSYILLPMTGDALNKAELILPNDTQASLVLDVKPDFKEITLGIWQNKAPLSNDAFFKLLDEKKSEFTGFPESLK